MQRLYLLLPLLLLAGAASAAETEEQMIARRLEWFRDQKFGFFMHWGAYSQLGCIESWPLVWADRSWSNPSIKTMEEMLAFRKKYFALNTTFNPTKFDPAPWAALAKRAGMKYVVFTTKHHDGFSMFDTRLTDYRVTHPDCPHSRSPRADVTKAIFDAFRAEGFGIGAYFSKSDWHHPGYWDPARPALDRNPNYDTAKEPERWEGFVKFVHGQVRELTTNYGRIDILWLDGGQVRPPKQDVRMDELAAMARKNEPELLIVDRTAGTRHENYRTPEQEVPDRPLDYAWESCITMGDQWSFKPDDRYKSTRQLVHLLVDVVAKGGNLLLNVGPTPEGTLPAEAVKRMEEIGDWMAVNASAIHGTRPVAPYKAGRVCFTRKGDVVNAIFLAEGEATAPPATITWPARDGGPVPAAGSAVKLLGVEAPLEWKREGDHVVILVPEAVRTRPPCQHAWVVSFTVAR